MDRTKQQITSCLVLELPGRWRSGGLAVLFLAAIVPAVPLLYSADIASIDFCVVSAFSSSLLRSTVLALIVTAVSFTLGLPAGVLAGLYNFPGRTFFLAVVCLPLLVPSFLSAIGWSSLAARLGFVGSISGLAGCAVVFSPNAVSIVLLTSYAASLALSGSQIDAARLAGGERSVLIHTCYHAAIPALLAAGLGGVLTLSDPGPGQILGLQTAASEILTSFSAFYDFTLAGQQCIALAALVLVFTAPLAYFAAPRIGTQIMARQSQPIQRIRQHCISSTAICLFGALVLFGTIIPLLGLILPLTEETAFLRALEEVTETAGNTLFYAAGAGSISAVFGLLLAVCVGRNERLRTVCLGMLFMLFSLPPTFSALGIIHFATGSPPWADVLVRSRFTVCLALGLRFFPVAAIICLRYWASMSRSWILAAGIHGISLWKYIQKIVFPFIFPACAVSVLLIGLLATADVGVILLIHPPGQRSFPLAIFTVMANAPESLVASLCLVYVTAAAIFLALFWNIMGKD